MNEEPKKQHGPLGTGDSSAGHGLSKEETQRLDEMLRRDLEPHPVAVARVVRGALKEPAPAPQPRWRVAVVGAFLLLAVLAIPRTWFEAPPVEESPPTAQHQRLRISNEEGLVVVTTPASALVILGDSL